MHSKLIDPNYAVRLQIQGGFETRPYRLTIDVRYVSIVAAQAKQLPLLSGALD
jgi:hypothetical protein